MKTLVIYDTKFGNTKEVAEAIGRGVPGGNTVIPAGEADIDGIPSCDLLIIGSPTHGGRPTPALQGFLASLTEETMAGKKFAAFDTRVPAKWVKIIGFAAGRIAKPLKKLGAVEVAPPEGFYVTATEGPMRDGEIDRAVEWGKMVGENKLQDNK